MAYRTTLHSTTHSSPFYRLHGREMVLPKGRFKGQNFILYTGRGPSSEIAELEIQSTESL